MLETDFLIEDQFRN